MADRLLADWFKAYGEFTAESDSPQIFHMWCGLGAICGAAQRKVFMQTAYFYVHSNMYVVLVSPPGVGKKTSALRTSKNILREIKPEVNFATESGSFEGLVNLFIQITNPAHQSLTLYSMELGTLMATNPAGMTDWLTDIYDGNPDWARATVAHKKQTIKRPWLNMMIGTTPRWLGEHAGLIALEGGLIARCILAYSEERITDNPWPELTPEMQTLQDALIHDLCIIAKLEGEFKFEGGKDGDAYQWYHTWYRNRPAEWENMAAKLNHPHVPNTFKPRYPEIHDLRTASYYDRKPYHILKVAMALSMSYKNELILSLEDLLRAKDLLDRTEPGIRLALKAVGKSDTANELHAIVQQIQSQRHISYGKLLMDNYHVLRYGKKSLDQILEELRFMGKIKTQGNDYVFVESA